MDHTDKPCDDDRGGECWMIIAIQKPKKEANESAVNFLNHGFHFLLSAKNLNENLGKLGPHKMASTFFCITHAYELLIKAFLFSVGYEENKLKKHNLETLLKMAKEKGFSIQYSDEYEIEELNKYVPDHEFRYPKMGDKFLADRTDLIDLGLRIHSQIQDFIKDKNTNKDAT